MNSLFPTKPPEPGGAPSRPRVRLPNIARKVLPMGVAGCFAGGMVSPLMAGQYRWTTFLAKGVGLPSTDSLNDPQDIARDANGNFFIADSGNHIVRKVTPAGVVTIYAGYQGIRGYVNGTGANARLSSPHGITVTSDGAVYVSEIFNHTIRKITGTGSTGAVSTYVSGLFDPRGMGTDAVGNIYLAEYGPSKLKKIAPGGGVTTLAGGYDSAEDGPLETATFRGLAGVAVDSENNLYIADQHNYTIRKVSDGIVSTLAGLAPQAGHADGTGSAARFDRPRDVAVDSAGNVYVSDTYNQLVRKISPQGEVTTIGGQPDVSGSTDGDDSAALFNLPSGLIVDPQGIIYIADLGNDRIRKGTPIPPTPYEIWTDQNGLTGGPMDNHDSDGLVNLLEYAFGTDPKIPTSASSTENAGEVISHGLPGIRFSHEGELTLPGAIFSRRKDAATSGLIYTVNFSADLTTWTPDETIPEILASDETMEIVSVPFPAPSEGEEPARFFQVVVTLPGH